MKAVFLDGSPAGDPLSSQVREILVDELRERRWAVEPLTLREMEIHHCLGCFGCWVRTPGRCVIDDDGGDVARAVIGSEMLIYFTPVTFGGYASDLKRAVDRTICLLSPFFTKIDGEVHHKRRYERYPRLLGVGVLPRPDGESASIFETLVARNALNMHAPLHAGGVIVGTEGENEIRGRVQALLDAVEVKR